MHLSPCNCFYLAVYVTVMSKIVILVVSDNVLSKDMATVHEYLQIWKLKLSTTKMVLAVFHL